MARPDRVRDDPWWQFGLYTVGTLFRLGLKLRAEGGERIPERGPAILASNHISPLDPIAVAVTTSSLGRTVRYLTAAEAFRIPVIGWGLRRFRQIPIRRGAGDVGAIEAAEAIVRSGALAGIFPEGGLGSGPELQPFRKGMARIALAANVPVVPMGVWGTQRRWPRGGIRFSRPLRPVVSLRVGDPILPNGDADSLTGEVMLAIERLVRDAQGVAGL